MADASTCPACGAAFGCGAREGGCWCTELTLSPEATARARELGGDTCLCPACLRALVVSDSCPPRPRSTP